MVTHPRTHAEFYISKCLCCSCRRRRTNRSKYGIEIMEPQELTLALKAARRGKPWAYAAFQVANNAMMLPSEIITLTRRSIIEAKPCRLRFTSANSRVSREVPLDCVTLDALRDVAGLRDGRIFGFCEKTLNREWRETTKRAREMTGREFYAYNFTALRQTGIARRVEAVRSLADLLDAQKAARIKELCSLKPYMKVDIEGYYRRVAWGK